MTSGLGTSEATIQLMTANPDRISDTSSQKHRQQPNESRQRVVSDRGQQNLSTSTPDLPLDEILALLSDDHACAILRALDERPLPARALMDKCGMSRSTVYRRLDRLTGAGLVESTMRPQTDGHHRQEFKLVLDEVAVTVGADGLDGTLRVCDPSTTD